MLTYLTLRQAAEILPGKPSLCTVYRTCKQPFVDMLARETTNILFLNYWAKSWTADMERFPAERFGGCDGVQCGPSRSTASGSTAEPGAFTGRVTLGVD